MTCDEYYHLRSVSVPIPPPPPQHVTVPTILLAQHKITSEKHPVSQSFQIVSSEWCLATAPACVHDQEADIKIWGGKF